MAPGEHGKISDGRRGDVFIASCYVRDYDGERRRVERSSTKSKEDARRRLQRHLADRKAPAASMEVNDRTNLSELFERWLTAKEIEDGILPQTAAQYRQVWTTHGMKSLGALRISELSTARANARLHDIGATTPTQAAHLRIVLRGMFGMAVRYDVLTVNPISETKVARTKRKPPRALTPQDFDNVRAAVKAFAAGKVGKGGPKPGRLLAAFIEVAAATGCRVNEVLALRWEEVDLLADPPTVTVSGTLKDHGAVPGVPLHRQDFRKHNAPPHTVVLPDFGVEVLTQLLGMTGPSGPVFATRDGGWVSASNLRSALRRALPDDLKWVTPHSFRRTVATVVRDGHGPAKAQQQMSHAKLATTEVHYLEAQTRGPDVRVTLDRFAAGTNVEGK